MSSSRTFVNATWSIQRSEFGEQPIWALIALATMLGQVGLPGGGFGIGYSCVNQIGSPARQFEAGSLPQGHNSVADFIPVARFSDMLLNPNGAFEFDGRTQVYPDVRLVYWAGGNPFHHAQDINKLRRALTQIETLVVHEISWTATAQSADIVLPIKAPQERRDFACATRENVITPMLPLHDAPSEARTDFEVFRALSRRLGLADAFDERLDEEGWLRRLYGETCQGAKRAQIELPCYKDFMAGSAIELPLDGERVLFDAFRRNIGEAALPTPSGRIELFSDRIASFAYSDCSAHPSWIEPKEWLGASNSLYPLHLISHQPSTRLHSQMEAGELSRGAKIGGCEPIAIHPEDAAVRGIVHGDKVEVINSRGSFIAGAKVSDEVMRGVAVIATGAWYHPENASELSSTELNGNPNVVTQDRGTSRLAQGSTAMSCLVEIRPFGS